MGNFNAIVLYSLLEANNFYAGVSGTGDSTTFSVQQIERALNTYRERFNDGNSLPNSYFLAMDRKQIMNFISNCLETAQKEESVRVYFG